MEVVRPLDGDAVTLRPCPPWCAGARHFAVDEVIYADHGYHHYGTEIEVPTSSPGSVTWSWPASWTGSRAPARCTCGGWTTARRDAPASR
jgi:hypothetical protein